MRLGLGVQNQHKTDLKGSGCSTDSVFSGAQLSCSLINIINSLVSDGEAVENKSIGHVGADWEGRIEVQSMALEGMRSGS